MSYFVSRLNYFQRIQFEMVSSNQVASTQKTNGAWQNKKTKTAKRIRPRGKAFKRMDSLFTNIWRVNLTD